MQASALHTALSPLPGTVSRNGLSGLPGEPADDAPDFGQELRAATGRADEIALATPVDAGSRTPAARTPNIASTGESRQRAATARPGSVSDTTAARGASVGAAEARGKEARREGDSALTQAGVLQTPGSTQAAPQEVARVMARQVTGLPPHSAGPAAGTPPQTGGGLKAGQGPGEPAPVRLADATREPALARDTVRAVNAAPTAGAALSTDEGTISPITARMPAEAGTVTIGRQQAVDAVDGAADPMQALLPQRVLRLAEDGIESARIDLDIASSAPLEVRIAREADTVRVDLTSTDRQVHDRLEAALPAVAAALHAAGLKLADGGVHARLPDPGPNATSDLARAEDGLDIAADTMRSANASASASAAEVEVEVEVEAADDALRARAPARPDDITTRPEPQGRDDAAGPAVRDLAGTPTAAGDRQTQTGSDRASPQAVTPQLSPAGAARSAQPEARGADWNNRGPALNPTPARPNPESRANGAQQHAPGHTSSTSDGATAQGSVTKPNRSPAGSAAVPTAPMTDAAVTAATSARRGLPVTNEARTVADRTEAADAPVRAGAQASAGVRPQPQGAAMRQTADAQGELERARGGRTPVAPAVPTAADPSGIQAMQTLQSLQAVPAVQAFMAGMPEGRTSRAGTTVSAAEGARAATRSAASRREPGPLRPEAQATAAAQMSLPAMMASGQAVSPSTAGSGVTFEGAARALEAAASSRQPDPDASALATGALPTATGDASFSAALDLAGPPLPEFMLRESLDSPAFAPALSARIATLVREGIEEARIQLNPADMGPVAVQLALEGSDVRVDLAAEVESTRQILEQALPSLASALRESGFTLTGGGVFQQPRDTGGGDRGAQDSRHGPARPDPATETVTTATVSSAGRRPRSGLVDLYA